MKRLCLRLSVIGLLATSLSNVYAAIPAAKTGLSLSLTGLYLQPNASNLTYAVYTQPLPITIPNWTQVTVKPSYSGAFDLGFQYNLVDAMNHVNFDWLHLRTSDSDSHPIVGTGDSIAPPYYFGPLAQALNGSSASSKVKFSVDNGNLIMGRLINLGNYIQIDPFAGLQFAYLKQDITSTYLGTGSDGNPYSITSNNTSKFNGVGPRLGIGATYFVIERFGISAKIGGALLVGSMDTNTNFNSFGAGNHTLVNTTLANQSQNRVVPEADSKLEVNYTAPLKNGSSVAFALGYLFGVYFDGINQVVPGSLVPSAFNGGVIAIETSQHEQSNLSLNGPYATVIFKFE